MRPGTTHTGGFPVWSHDLKQYLGNTAAGNQRGCEHRTQFPEASYPQPELNLYVGIHLRRSAHKDEQPIIFMTSLLVVRFDKRTRGPRGVTCNFKTVRKRCEGYTVTLCRLVNAQNAVREPSLTALRITPSLSTSFFARSCHHQEVHLP